MLQGEEKVLNEIFRYVEAGNLGAAMAGAIRLSDQEMMEGLARGGMSICLEYIPYANDLEVAHWIVERCEDIDDVRSLIFLSRLLNDTKQAPTLEEREFDRAFRTNIAALIVGKISKETILQDHGTAFGGMSWGDKFLHQVAFEGHSPLVALLVEKGIDLDMRFVSPDAQRYVDPETVSMMEVAFSEANLFEAERPLAFIHEMLKHGAALPVNKETVVACLEVGDAWRELALTMINHADYRPEDAHYHLIMLMSLGEPCFEEEPFDIAQALLDRGGDFNPGNAAFDRNLLNAAIGKGYVQSVRLMLERGITRETGRDYVAEAQKTAKSLVAAQAEENAAWEYVVKREEVMAAITALPDVAPEPANA